MRTVTFRTLIKAQAGMECLTNLNIKDYSLRYQLFKLYKALHENLQFYSEQERLAVIECGGTVDGTAIRFSGSGGADFVKKREALADTPVEMPPVVLLRKEDLGDDFSISIGNMYALEDFVQFEEERIRR